MNRDLQKWFAVASIAGMLMPSGHLFAAAAKIDCGPVSNKSDKLPRSIAVGTNPAGTGAHAVGIVTVVDEENVIGGANHVEVQV